jgi:hypothetical protein
MPVIVGLLVLALPGIVFGLGVSDQDATIGHPFNCPSGCSNELRIDPFTNGHHSDGTLNVTISGYGSSPYGFTWTSNLPICYLIIKVGAADNASGFNMSGETSGTWDGGLLNQSGEEISAISHVSFCYDTTEQGSIKINKTTTNGLTGTFNFTIAKNEAGFTPITPSIVIDASGSGSATISGLLLGTYTVTEDGATGTNMAYTVTVPSGGSYNNISVTNGGTAEADFTNEGTLTETGCIRIYKEVTGAAAGSVNGTYTFAIYEADKTTLAGTASITFNNGVADPDYDDVCGLELGEVYYIEETGGPEGENVTLDLIDGKYLAASPCGLAATVATDSIKMSVAELPGCEVRFTNDPEEEKKEEGGCIEVLKVDENGDPLSGAEFTLREDDGTFVFAKTTDGDGKVLFCKLGGGDYVLTETVTPAGYTTADPVPVSVTVGKTTKVTIENNKSGTTTTTTVEVQALTGEVEVLAFTGYNTIYYIIGFAMILMGALGSILLRRRLKRE